MKLLILIALFALTVNGASAEDAIPVTGVQGVYAVEVGGQRYLVTELKDTSREKISRWNILRLKRGLKIWTYGVIDSKMPLRLYEAQYEKNKAILDQAPDVRPDDQKHPVKHAIEQFGPATNCIVNFVMLLTGQG
ncbi:MAG: hypothetical protein K2W95_15885 [Candidatus Obscuribacterales bacterium]|nr:hypothetical protein [Candidatus Obscuribacterales bacterium]